MIDSYPAMVLTGDSNQNVLVTGATGFVGGRLVEALVQQGCLITCLVRNTSYTRKLQQMPGVRLVLGDLEHPDVLRDTVRDIRTVYHVAGAIKAAGREHYLQINQIGTRRLLETLAGHNVQNFIHISSLAAAGPSSAEKGLVENESPKPISWYGESKLRSEEEVLKFAEAFRVTIIRPSAVYGPGDRETLLIFRMIKRGCLLTPGRVRRQFSLIHVDDLTAAIIQASRQATRSGEIFFVSRPEHYTWDDVGRAIAQALGRNFRKIAFPRLMAEMAGAAGDIWTRLTGRPSTISSQKVKELLEPSWLCNSSKAALSFGFNPKINLENGMRETALWYQNQGWL